MVRSIAILEPHATGHRGAYVGWIAQAAAERGIPTRIVGAAGLAEVEAVQRALQAGAELRPAAAPAPSRLGPLATQFACRDWMLRLAGRHRDLAEAAWIVPFFDSAFWAVALAGLPAHGAGWVGITLRTGFPLAGEHWRGRRALRLGATARVLRSSAILRLFAIDPSTPGWLEAQNAWYWRKLAYLPDPSLPLRPMTATAARERLGIGPGERVVLVVGSLDVRKGVAQLLDAIDGAGCESGLRWTVLLAGRQTEAVRSLLRERVGRARRIVIDAFLSDSEFAECLHAADVVWAGYVGHVFSSGIVTTAGRAGKVVVGCDEGAIGALVRHHGLGVACNVHDRGAVARALAAALEPAVRERAATSGPAAFRNHTPESFGAAVVAAATGGGQ